MSELDGARRPEVVPVVPPNHDRMLPYIQPREPKVMRADRPALVYDFAEMVCDAGVEADVMSTDTAQIVVK